MADDIDRASEQEAKQRDAAINNARASTKYIAATGYCLECGAKVGAEMRWCDNFCRDDWQRWNPEA